MNIKSYTDFSQSKVLAKILPLESADFHYVRKSTDFSGKPVAGKWSEPKYGNPEKAAYVVQNFSSYEKLPCWSLASLLNYLRMIDFFPDIEADEHSITMNVNYYNEEEARPLAPVHNIEVKADTFVDACYEITLKLHELNLL